MDTQKINPSQPTVSIVTAAYNEEQNLPVFYDRIAAALTKENVDWEWIIVDDHSSDRTFEVVGKLFAKDARVKGFRLARNSGSHNALRFGLSRALGKCAVVMASDLQDPPESIPRLLRMWEEGSQMVWAARADRLDETFFTLAFSRLYYFLIRHVAGFKQVPANGADFFLLDRIVLEALKEVHEVNVNLFVVLAWMGFRQSQIEYVKQPRLYGRSGWTFKKKMKLVVDSVTSLTCLPLRLMTYVGVAIATLGFAFAIHVLINSFYGHPIPGWSSLMISVLVLGGGQMLMMGIMGEYLWRTLEQTRRRPACQLEASHERIDSAPLKLTSSHY